MSEQVVRVKDGWQLPVFRGLGVGELVISDSVHLRAGSHEITLHARAEVLAVGETFDLAVTPRTNLGKVTDLLGQVFADVSAFEPGILQIHFANGWRLRVPADAERPGWVVVVRGEGILAAKSGGGISATGALAHRSAAPADDGDPRGA